MEIGDSKVCFPQGWLSPSFQWNRNMNFRFSAKQCLWLQHTIIVMAPLSFPSFPFCIVYSIYSILYLSVHPASYLLFHLLVSLRPGGCSRQKCRESVILPGGGKAAEGQLQHSKGYLSGGRGWIYSQPNTNLCSPSYWEEFCVIPVYIIKRVIME